jgi:cell division septum initiation protein DivIVA
MSEHGHHLPVDVGHDDQFEREMRGYNRRAVDEYVAALRIDLRSLEDAKGDLEIRLSQALDEGERIKLELSAARSAGKPPHQEISERIGQILKLADDEAKSQRVRAEEEIAKLRSDAQAETTKLRSDVKAETDKTRAEAHEQAERMLSAAQEQAENTVATAKADADKTRKSAAAEAQQVLTDATKQAETAVATAKAQAKQQLDEATARATAIHDGAERRLNLLTAKHTDSIRRLTEIRDVVTSLVAGETERGSLEDEVARSVAGAIAAGQKQPTAPAEGRHASVPGQTNGQPPTPARGGGAPSGAAPSGAAPSGAAPSGAAPSASAGSPAAGPAGTAAGNLTAGPGPAVPGQRPPVANAATQQPAGNGAPSPAQPGSVQGGRQSDATRPVHPDVRPGNPDATRPGHPDARPGPAARPGPDGDDTSDGLKIIRD